MLPRVHTSFGCQLLFWGWLKLEQSRLQGAGWGGGEFGGWSLCRHVPMGEVCAGVTAWGKLARDVSKVSILVISIMSLPSLPLSLT